MHVFSVILSLSSVLHREFPWNSGLVRSQASCCDCFAHILKRIGFSLAQEPHVLTLLFVVVRCNSFQTQYIDTQDDAYVSGSVTRCQETSLRERFVSAHICHALMHRRRDASDSEVSVRHDLFSLENTLASCWTCLYLVFCAQACLGSWPLVCPGTTPPPH